MARTLNPGELSPVPEETRADVIRGPARSCRYRTPEATLRTTVLLQSALVAAIASPHAWLSPQTATATPRSTSPTVTAPASSDLRAT